MGERVKAANALVTVYVQRLPKVYHASDVLSGSFKRLNPKGDY